MRERVCELRARESDRVQERERERERECEEHWWVSKLQKILSQKAEEKCWWSDAEKSGRGIEPVTPSDKK